MTKFLAFILGSVVTAVLSLVLFRWVRRTPAGVLDEAALAAARAAVAADMAELTSRLGTIEQSTVGGQPSATQSPAAPGGEAAGVRNAPASSSGQAGSAVNGTTLLLADTSVQPEVTAFDSARADEAVAAVPAKTAPKRRKAVGHGSAIGEARTWARENGWQVGDRGPLSEAIWKAFQEAQQSKD